MALEELQAIEVATAELVGAIIFVLVVLATGKLFIKNADDFASGVRWWWRGLKARQRVIFDGKPARVMSRGSFTTFFELQNGRKTNIICP